MNLREIANTTIPRSEKTKVLKYKAGITRDIIKEVLECYRDKKYQVKKFAPYLKGDTVLDTCNNIWKFWKENITYKVDESGVQWIKSPRAVWDSKFCDCKSFSVAVASCLDALGIAGKFRFVSFGLNKSMPTHVYVVAMHQGKEIIIDCVWDYFNSEKPYAKKWEYNMTSIYRIDGIGESKYKPGELNIDVNDPNVTEAQLELALNKQTLEMEQMINRRKGGIRGINTELDNRYQVAIEAHTAALGAIAGKKAQARKLKKAMRKNDGKGVNKRQARLLERAGIAIKKRKEGLLKKVGKGLKKVVKAIPRLLVKTQLPKSAPFFLYTFITDERVLAKLPEVVAVKKAKADHYKKIIVEKLEMKPENFDKVIRNGIMNNFGDTPENVIARWMKDANFSVGIIPIVAAAASVLWGLIKKLAGKAVENLKNDVQQYTPAPEDWGNVSQASKDEMANQQQNSYSNSDVQPYDQQRETDPADDPTGDGVLTKTKDMPDVTIEAEKKDGGNFEPQEAGGGSMILLALLGVGLLAGSGGKKSRRAA